VDLSSLYNSHSLEIDKYTKRSKKIAALRTIIFRTHYLHEKFLTNGYINKAIEIISGIEYRFLVCSFIWTTKITESVPKLNQEIVFIETHNDEIQWFRNLKNATLNPVSIFISSISERWVRAFFKRAPREWIFLHLTEKDKNGYQNLAPDHKPLLAPVGIEVKQGQESTDLIKGKNQISLLFVGALGVKMNLDALVFFRDNYYPDIKANVNNRVDIHIAGSNPSSKIMQLCKQNGWKLHANLSDDQLAALYQSAHLSILPFPYTTGSKLKLLNSIANSLPFIATSNLSHQLGSAVPLCLFSDNPEEWSNHINRVSQHQITEEEIEGMRIVANQYSWEKVTDDLHAKISKILNNISSR